MNLQAPNRISEEKVRQALDAADNEFRWCWNVVAAMAGLKKQKHIGQSVIDFQLRLFDAIAALESLYRKIRNEERRLIERKSQLNYQWFSKRMAKLAAYRSALRNGFAVGRAIGDGFAWFFYERDRNLIEEHLKHHYQPLLPPHIGRQGERSSLSAMPYIDGKFLIYHGTTTLLRMGDVSFIDMNTMRVACIGELKTQRISEKTLSISAVFVADAENKLPKFNMNRRPKGTSIALADAIKQRLNRQIKQYSEAMETAQCDKAEPVHAGQLSFHYDTLEQIVERSHERAFEYAATDDGLLLGAVRFRRSDTLGKALLKDHSSELNRLLANLRPAVEKIMYKGSKKNSLVIETIGAGSDDLIASTNQLPLAMWPLSAKALGDILFANVLVISIYNPIHFSEALKARGYEVVTNERGEPKSAVRTDGGKRQKLENLEHFTALIQRALIAQKSVLDMIDQVSAKVEEKASGKSFGASIIPRFHRFRSTS